MRLLKYKQKTDWTCGPACLKVALDFFGVKKDVAELIEELETTEKKGTDHKEIMEVVKKYGLKPVVKENAGIEDLKRYLSEGYLVMVDYWIPFHQESHYSLVKRIDKKRIYFHDTHFGFNHSYKIDYFLRNWRDEEAKGWMMALGRNMMYGERC